MDALSRLRTGPGLSICEYLSGSPDASRLEIARKIKATGSTVSWYLRNLCDARLVSIAREGKSVRYRLTPAAESALDTLKCSGGA
jgi:predicted transcriptional regulator